MQYIFQGGNEIIKLDIDRENKILHIATSLTNYQLKRTEWWKLFDKGKERSQEKLTDGMGDEDFEKLLILNFTKQGYTFKKKI